MSEPAQRSATLAFTVTEDDTAAALGSGSLPVLATPRLLAWCEAATCAALEPTLPEGSTSVGTRISLEHLADDPLVFLHPPSVGCAECDEARRAAAGRSTVAMNDRSP